MLTGSVCIASKTNAKNSTLQAMAPIPAFMAGSMLWSARKRAALGEKPDSGRDLFVALQQAVRCKTDGERGLYASTAVLLRNVLHSKTNGAGTNSATYNRTSQRIARKELRADQTIL
jgi:hypothetical protein